MKKWFFLVIAAALIGFAIFAALFWLTGSDWTTSFTVALAGGLGALAGELMRAYFERRKTKKMKNNG